MNTQLLEKRVSHAAIAFFVSVAVLYGGSKHSPTNTPPMMMCARPSALQRPTITTITNWNARGAWKDWVELALPDGFTFPVGFERYSSLTLMSQGEVRIASGGASLPTQLAIKPGHSSVTYRLTASNSFHIAWNDCFADRSPTNEVDAVIELFANGDIRTSVTGITPQPQPPTDIPAPPPPGYVGHGQDADWIRATFPADSTNILAVGYTSWLDDWVGINAQNGRYQLAVTIGSAAEFPCGLVCGSFRVFVTEPGTYRFPLEVFETYEVHTIPAAQPFTYSVDDGYRGEGVSYEIVEERAPAPVFAPPKLQLQTITLQPSTTNLTYHLEPKVVLTPDHIPLDKALNAVVEIWCNMTNVTAKTYQATVDQFLLTFGDFDAHIDEVSAACAVRVVYELDAMEASGELVIEAAPVPEGNGPERFDADIFSGETWHVAETNGRPVYALTVETLQGSTATNTTQHVLYPSTGESVCVGVFMATTEWPNNPLLCCDDHVGWRITATGNDDFTGSTSVQQQLSAIPTTLFWVNGLYGVLCNPIILAAQRLTAPVGENMEIRLQAWAQNAVDGLRSTCLQIVIFPIDENGNVLGWPPWAGAAP